MRSENRELRKANETSRAAHPRRLPWPARTAARARGGPSPGPVHPFTRTPARGVAGEDGVLAHGVVHAVADASFRSAARASPRAGAATRSAPTPASNRCCDAIACWACSRSSARRLMSRVRSRRGRFRRRAGCADRLLALAAARRSLAARRASVCGRRAAPEANTRCISSPAAAGDRGDLHTRPAVAIGLILAPAAALMPGRVRVVLLRGKRQPSL